MNKHKAPPTPTIEARERFKSVGRMYLAANYSNHSVATGGSPFISNQDRTDFERTLEMFTDDLIKEATLLITKAEQNVWKTLRKGEGFARADGCFLVHPDFIDEQIERLATTQKEPND